MLSIALRSLSRGPGFSIVVIATLAVGIGANVTLFSVVHDVLFEPLAFPRSDDLLMVWERNVPRERATNVVSPSNFLEWRDQSQTLIDMAAMAPGAVTLTGDHAPVRVPSARVSDRFFSVLQVEPLLGRVFTAEDADNVTVLDYRAWQSRLGGDPSVLGSTVRLSEVDYTIVGVMPESFRFELEPTESTLGIEADFFRPLLVTDEWREHRGRYLAVVARKSSSVTVSEVRSEMDVIAARLEREHPGSNAGWGVNVVPLSEQIVGPARSTLWLLFGAVAMMLLLACVNIASLLVGRAVARRREVAIRTALGAGSRRIASQLMVESGILSGLACIVGVGLAFGSVYLLQRDSPIALPRLDTVSVDGTALFFALALAAVTTVVFGLVPTLQSRDADVQRMLRGGAAGSVSSLRLRSSLVVIEVGLTVMLVAAAGILVRTLVSYRAVDPGFDRADTLTMKLSLPEARYSSDASRLAFFDAVRERLEVLGGVEAVSAVSSVPLTGPHAATRFHAEDHPPPADGESPVADVRIVAGDYFRTMGIPLVTGRVFDASDNEDRPRCAILSEAAADVLWPGESASELIGKTVQISWGELISHEVVGVVGDVRHAGLAERPRPMIYWPHHQHAWGEMSLVVRGGGNLAGVQSEIWTIDPSLALYDVQPLEDILSGSVETERVTAYVFGAFAIVALILAGLGVYGVIAFFVSERHREMGLRLALGASPARVMSMIVRQGMSMALVGVTLGVIGATWSTRYLSSLVFGVRPFDPLTIVTACLVLLAVAVGASYFPAKRASRVDPIVTLRDL